MNPIPTDKKGIALRLAELRREIACIESIHTGCTTCDAYTGRACKRANGQEPPPEIIPQGCPEWKWDEIPF